MTIHNCNKNNKETRSMKVREALPIICLMPILVIYSIAELRRGWRILKRGEFSLNPTLQTRIWLLKKIRGNEIADEYRKGLLMDKNGMRLSGVYSLVGSLILLIGSAILILSWII